MDEEYFPAIQGPDRDRYNLLCGRIIESKHEVGKNLYNIGLYLNEIKSKLFYTLEFNDFGEFLRKRVSIPRSTAFETMRIAQNYSLVEWQDMGYSKCNILLRIKDESERSDFIKKAPIAQMPTRELGKAVTEYKIEKGLEETRESLKKSLTGAKQLEKVTEKEKPYNVRRRGLKMIEWVESHIQTHREIKKQMDVWLEESVEFKDWDDLPDIINQIKGLRRRF